MLLVHSRKAEDKFVADGYAKERFDVMYNDFIIVGPKDDPAKIAGTAAAKDAFKAIMDAKARVRQPRRQVGHQHQGVEHLVVGRHHADQGDDVVQLARPGHGRHAALRQREGAYTLADRGTYLSMQDKLPDLTILVGGKNLAENKDKSLLNPYGVLAVNPDKLPGVNSDLAQKFVTWILSSETQKMIGGYGVDKYGQPLFYPSSTEYKAAQAAAAPADVALKITGKVGKEQGWPEADVKAMKAIDVQSTNSKGETATYTGVLLSDLLALAAPAADAKTIVFVADDGYHRRGAPGRRAGLQGLHRVVPQQRRFQHRAAQLRQEPAGEGRHRDQGQVVAGSRRHSQMHGLAGQKLLHAECSPTAATTGGF